MIWIKAMRWRLALPALQLFLAVGLWLYIPFEFHDELIARMNLTAEQLDGRSLDLSPDTIHMYFPPLGGRLLYTVNFPAFVLASRVEDTLTWRTTPALQFSNKDSNGQVRALYNFGIREITFFLGVCALWFWVGARIDGFYQKRSSRNLQKRAWVHKLEKVAVLVIGVVLAWQCFVILVMPTCTRPVREIATFGLVWPIACFADTLFYALRTLQRSSRA